MTKPVICTAKSVDEAINAALKQLNASRDQVDIKVIAEPQKRLIGRDRLAEVEVTLKVSASDKSPKEPAVPKDNNGKLWVKNGKLQYQAPKADGKHPVLVFNELFSVQYNDAEVKNRLELTDGFEALSVALPNNQEPKRLLGIDVSADKIKADLITQLAPGVSYRLKDASPTNMLELTLEQNQIPVQAVTSDEVMELVEKTKITYGLMIEDALECVKQKGSCSVLIAEGRQVVPPENGKIDYIFQNQDSGIDLDADVIDYFELHSVPNVKSGDLLATITPSTPGIDGINVHGAVIKAPLPKEPQLNVGEGVRLDEQGLNAYATQAGQPTLQNGVLKVVQIYEIKGDANVNTGHIRFNGEVIIKGNVCEQVQIRASGGGVQIHGLVDRAIIDADQHVLIARNAIGTQISAGGMSILHVRLSAFLTELQGHIVSLRKAFQLVQDQNSEYKHGVLIKNLLELKYGKIPQLIANYDEEFADMQKNLEADFRTLMTTLKTYFTGRGPLAIENIAEIDLVMEQLDYWIAIYRMSSKDTADVTVNYLQNTRVEASGFVKISGQGAYNSHIVAGKGFEQPRGVFRGGSISVKEGDIKVKELGGPTGIKTKAFISGSGRITIGSVYSNVEIGIGHYKYIFVNEATNVRIYTNSEDGLNVYSGNKKLT